MPTAPAADPRNRARTLIIFRTEMTWAKRGACHLLGQRIPPTQARARRELSALFFPTRESNQASVDLAKSICAECPVRLECLTYSIQYWERVGIWGGETEHERRNTRKSMRRAGIKSGDDARALKWVVAHLARGRRASGSGRRSASRNTAPGI